ncbi:MAG: thioredoxin [Calditrichaeota bacterium]|nr:MAG: thioredoxin [Calditrichota bacterium]
MKQHILPALFLMLALLWGCERGKAGDPTTAGDNSKAQVTFVELGSVNCIPCKAMQPIMKAVEEEYGDQVKVVFHDVWKDPEPGKKYGIRLIPTQVFLDDKGVEFHRHEGFYPQEEIDKILMGKGLKKKTATGKS